MSSKERKAIKKLTKRVKKLDGRIDRMSIEIRTFQDSMRNTFAEQFVAKPNFSQEEMDTAEDMAETAEEIADIREKMET